MLFKRISVVCFPAIGLLVAMLLAGCDKRADKAGAMQSEAYSSSASGSAETNSAQTATHAGRSADLNVSNGRLPADTWFSIKVGDKVVQMQLAITEAEQARGLMGRKSLDTNHGMLFVFNRGKRQSFWMANTPLPLDIGYFDGEGVLREVYPLYPFDRTSVASQRSDIRYALEMAQGWFGDNNVRPGARLDLKALDIALQRRR